eukprot:NODE_147_length_15617_cov_0.576750.p7 type:complete len:284 gc:universal NODE_147_length_15617_cov_0.576750:7710-6859(-)
MLTFLILFAQSFNLEVDDALEQTESIVNKMTINRPCLSAIMKCVLQKECSKAITAWCGITREIQGMANSVLDHLISVIQETHSLKSVMNWLLNKKSFERFLYKRDRDASGNRSARIKLYLLVLLVAASAFTGSMVWYNQEVGNSQEIKTLRNGAYKPLTDAKNAHQGKCIYSEECNLASYKCIYSLAARFKGYDEICQLNNDKIYKCGYLISGEWRDCDFLKSRVDTALKNVNQLDDDSNHARDGYGILGAVSGLFMAYALAKLSCKSNYCNRQQLEDPGRTN